MCQHPVDLAAVRLIAQQTIQLSRRCAARQSNGEAATRRNRFSGDARNILCCLLANHIDIRINRNIHGYIAPIFLFVCMDSARGFFAALRMTSLGGFFAALRMTGLRTGSETCHSERSEESAQGCHSECSEESARRIHADEKNYWSNVSMNIAIYPNIDVISQEA